MVSCHFGIQKFFTRIVNNTIDLKKTYLETEFAMNHYNHEQAKALTQLLKNNSEKSSERHVDKEVIESDLLWESSRFWANVIYKSQPITKKITPVNLKITVYEYEVQNNVKIDIEGLFNRFWIREILGQIEIPGAVSSACNNAYKKLKSRKKELIFMVDISSQIEQANRKINKPDFQTIISEYNKSNATAIDIDSIVDGKTGWASEKGDIIELSDIEYYFKPFLDHWDDFGFIEYLLQQNHQSDKGLLIDPLTFENIYASHSSFYSSTPSIEVFKEQRVIAQGKKHYVLNFFDSEISYWSGLDDKISGFYWELLIKDDSFNSDSERVIFFLSQITYYENFPDPLLFVLEDSKKRFLDAAFQLVSTENDLNYVQNEFHRICIDSHYSQDREFFHLEKNSLYKDYSLKIDDAFELYDSFQRWEEMARTTYFYNQRSRQSLESLIRLIVKHDYEVERIETEDEYNPKIERYKRTISLLESYREKPILLFYISSYITLYRREIIPLLLLNDEFITFSFQLIDKLKFKEEQQLFLSKRIWTESLNLALFAMRSHRDQKKLSAKMIYQIFCQLNGEKYFIPFNRNPYDEDLINSQKKQKENLVLALIEDAHVGNTKIKGSKFEYLLPSIFNELFGLFAKHDEKPLYDNGTVQFPMLQMDGMVWLMKCLTYWKYKDQFNKLKPETLPLIQKFFTLYMSKLEMTEIKKWDFINNVEKQAIPNWSERVERLQYIEWIYPVYFFSKHQKLNSFLEPRLSFETTDNKYHEMNLFTSDKLRTHIGVLIQVLQKLISSGVPHGFDKKELNEIKTRVEKQIIDYLKSHTKDIPKEGKIDLLEYQREVGYQNSGKEALLPQIARSINWFSDKEGIIDAIIDSNDVIKILTVAEFITSHGIKEILIEKIKKTDLQTFLEDSHWIPEIHTVLLKLTMYPQLMDQIIQIVDYWERKIVNRKKHYQDQLYRTKLLIAYYHKDEIELNSVKAPEKKNYIEANALSYYDYKEFYRALIHMEDNPESAYQIFNRLVNDFPKFPVFAINRMAAKMKIADQKNDTVIYDEILEEWSVYEKGQPDLNLMELGENFLINKSMILLKIERYDQLDKEYNALDLPYQMLPGILETKVEGLIAEKKIGEAMKLLDTAETFHKYSGVTEIEFIQNLKLSVQGIDNIDELTFYYERIFQSEPQKLIQILPKNLNGRIDFFEFITNEIGIAAYKMLNKINALSNIDDEDKYNDLLCILLESRISVLGWSIKDQTRRAYSQTGKDLGEIDIDIQNRNGQTLVTCEAFIYRDIPRVQSHISKLIGNYNHDRKAFIVIVYFQGTKFESKWKEYSEKIVPKLKYPTGYEISSLQVDDLSKEFGYDKSAIKIGCSMHGLDVPMYHVFVNINYKI